MSKCLNIKMQEIYIEQIFTNIFISKTAIFYFYEIWPSGSTWNVDYFSTRITHDYEKNVKHETSINSMAWPLHPLKWNFFHSRVLLQISLQNLGKPGKTKPTYFHYWSWNKWVSSSKLMMMTIIKDENGYDSWALCSRYLPKPTFRLLIRTVRNNSEAHFDPSGCHLPFSTHSVR